MSYGFCHKRYLSIIFLYIYIYIYILGCPSFTESLAWKLRVFGVVGACGLKELSWRFAEAPNRQVVFLMLTLGNTRRGL